jgi:DNA repair exonuclease SbcCD ATPase subunit
VVELNQISGALEAAGLAVRERARLRSADVDANKNFDEVLAAARRLTPELPAGDEATSFIEAELNSAREQLNRATQLHSTRSKALDDLEQSVDMLRALQKLVKDDEESAQLATKSASDGDGAEDNALNAELERLGELQEALQVIARAVQDVARARAGEAIESSRSSTSDYYSTLCDHPYFDKLRIDALEKTVAGVAKNNYVVRAFSTSDGRDTLAGSRLSTAQMNCVALSIYLALAGVLTHNLDFIILDDPSQNLDSKHKRALASVLKKIGLGTQLIVSTEDSELEGFLLDSLGRNDLMTYRLTWTPQQGTIATRA